MAEASIPPGGTAAANTNTDGTTTTGISADAMEQRTSRRNRRSRDPAAHDIEASAGLDTGAGSSPPGSRDTNGPGPASPEKAGEGHSGKPQMSDKKAWGFIPIRQAGESGRVGFHALQFVRVSFRSASWLSRAVNVLWPAVPACFAVRYAPATRDNHLLIFVLSYIAMVPCANLIGFAGQEFARKLPHTFGVMAETRWVLRSGSVRASEAPTRWKLMWRPLC